MEILSDVCGYDADVCHVTDDTVPARSYFLFRDMDLVLDVERITTGGKFCGPTLTADLAETWDWMAKLGVPRYEPTLYELQWMDCLAAGAVLSLGRWHVS